MHELSLGAKTAWRTAIIEACEDKHEYLEKEHILIGLLSLGQVLEAASGDDRFDTKILQEIRSESLALSVAFVSLGLDTNLISRGLKKHYGKGNFEHEENLVHRSQDCKEMFNRARTLTDNSGKINISHLAASILEEPGPIISKVLTEHDTNPAELRDKVLACTGDKTVEDKEKKKKKKEQKTHLQRYGRNLHEEAKKGKFGPFVGRDKEIYHTYQTLARSSKNNPVLVGEPGVGKTAVIEAIAVNILEGEVPPILENKEIIEINMGVILSGTRHRGEFEERLTKIIDEIKKNPKYILFIDEIHTLVGSGRGDGSVDAANIMKPALARGEFRCIGATTIKEYRRFIEEDSALERRFEKILINEPTRDDTISILKCIREELEVHHQVMISDHAIESAVDLSIRFDGDHQLPDKAIDLLDQAGASAQISIFKDMSEMDDDELDDSTIPEITDLEIVKELSLKTGIPKGIISAHYSGAFNKRLQALEPSLKERIKGQDEALGQICQRLYLAYAALSERQGPLAVYLFLGPSGVGKTETAKVLAKNLFGSEDDMIRLDMSEFMESHSISKLIGSPPGYVGHQEEGQLLGRLRSKPYSIVLLDEVEKAHPRIFDVFLQVFDEGRITDAKGRTIDARNAIFVLTSNILAGNGEGQKSVGFFKETGSKEAALPEKELRAFFKMELLNRIDEKIIFRPLDRDDMLGILRPMVAEITENLKAKHGVTLSLTEDAKYLIAEKGFSEDYGARELRRTVEDLLQTPLSRLIIDGKLKDSKNWKALVKDDAIVVRAS